MRTMLAAVAVALTCVACGGDRPCGPDATPVAHRISVGVGSIEATADHITWRAEWHAIDAAGAPVSIRAEEQALVEPLGNVQSWQVHGESGVRVWTTPRKDLCTKMTARFTVAVRETGPVESAETWIEPACAH